MRKAIWRWTWISNDGRTRKELDHILANSRAMVRSYRVYRGAKAQANTDRRLVVAVISLAFVHHAKPKKSSKFNVQRLTTDVHVRVAYNDSLQARLPLAVASANGVEEKWSQLSATINASAADTIGYVRPRRRPWISNETQEAVDHKAAARLAHDTKEWRRLCSVVHARQEPTGKLTSTGSPLRLKRV